MYPTGNIRGYNIIFSKTPRPISRILYEASIGRGTNVYINNPGHMTKMAAMSIYGKNPSKIFSGTAEPIAMNLDM